tara:strand:+ start:669 stop:941 length:273 start_codon:yes stop_codon:yes gene_type:complete
MKHLLSILILLGFVSVASADEFDFRDGYALGYEEGYEKGYEEGYDDADTRSVTVCDGGVNINPPVGKSFYVTGGETGCVEVYDDGTYRQF